MRRRDIFGLIGAMATWSGDGRAQSSAKALRVGTANVQPRNAPQWQAFIKRMADLGYRDGDNLVFDHVQVQGPEAWEEGYREVVSRKPDIVVAAGPERSLRAAVAVARSIPIVMIAVDYDPVAKGIVQSLSRPGGDVTGVYFQLVELVGKRVELLKQALPTATRMLVFWDGPSRDSAAALKIVAPQFGIELTMVEFREAPYDYEKAFMASTGDDTILHAIGSPFFFLDRVRLSSFAIQHKLALINDFRESAVAGGLMSYGPSITGLFALAAGYVDRIAKGTKPANLPVEQPSTFEFVINLQTAKSIGVTIPTALLARADEVIE